jgi:class 3 adenylate cyclase
MPLSTLPTASGPASALDARISGSFAHRYGQELLRNSGQFPIANLLLELLLQGWVILREPDAYVLVAAACVQAWVLTRWAAARPLARLAGQLVGPALYTLVEALLERHAFFSAPNHMAYWAYGAAIGVLQWAAPWLPGAARGAVAVAENVVRASILFVMYAIFETMSDPAPYSTRAFFADPSHVFIAVATLLLGLSAGLESRAAEAYLRLLRDTSRQLQRYSQWLFGAELLERVVRDPAVLSLARRERSVLFMDIRGFTAWAERCPPETVVQALNAYYAAAEPVLRRHAAIKMKLSADEILAVFARPRDAAACALALRDAADAALAPHGLRAGIGLHAGPVVEGLLGSEGIKGYDVIGDTVNTAKRIESAAAGGEVLVSLALRDAAGPGLVLGPRQDIAAKGKQAAVAACTLLAVRPAEA